MLTSDILLTANYFGVSVPWVTLLPLSWPWKASMYSLLEQQEGLVPPL
jgi:hypothetical protein